MEAEKRAQLLLAEYMQLQKIIEDFDGRALTIKAWSVTLSAAGIVAAYTQAQPVVLLIAAASALAFWLVETLWKAHQQGFYPRLYAIEAAMRDGTDIAPLQISTQWKKEYDAAKRGRLLRPMLFPHVFLPHLPVMVAGVGLWLWAAPAAG